MVVSLFFGVKYSFAGKGDLSSANRVMETAGDVHPSGGADIVTAPTAKKK